MEEVVKVFGLDYKLFIVQLINFGIVVFILTKLLYKPVLKAIDERRQVIEEGVNNARLSVEIKDNALKEAEGVKQDAKNHATKLIDESKHELSVYKAKMIEEAEKEKARLINEAKLNAEKVRESMIESSREQIAKMAVLSAEKILKEKLQ